MPRIVVPVYFLVDVSDDTREPVRHAEHCAGEWFSRVLNPDRFPKFITAVEYGEAYDEREEED